MIKNRTKDAILAMRAIPLKNFITQGMGVMFKGKLHGDGYIFLCGRKSRWDITNLFVFQSIDVLWLDEEQHVLQARTVKPFKLHVKGVSGTKTIVETAAGMIAKSETTIGDRITWEF